MTARRLALIAAAYGLAAVILAALGAHVLPEDQPGAPGLWATALQIHMFHSAVLMALAAWGAGHGDSRVLQSGLLLAMGVLLFSGSLYLRAAGIDLLPGPLTPIGGLVLMLGWALLIMTLVRKKHL